MKVFAELFGELPSFMACKTRASIIEVGKEKIEEEFNIANLIKKVRMSNDLWKNVLKKDQVKLMQM